MRENIKLLKIKYKDKDSNVVFTDNGSRYQEHCRTKHRIKPKGEYFDSIGNQNFI